MKKIMLIFILMFQIIVLNSCTKGYGVNNFKSLNIVIDNLEYNEEAKIYYYDNNLELQKLNNNIFNQYNDNYFKDNSLMIITVIDNINSEYTISGIENGVIGIYKNIDEDAALVEWTMLLEIKGKINDYVNYYVSLLDREDHGHSYLKTIVDPTCQEKGYTIYRCPCGKNYQDNYIEQVMCVYENNQCIWCKEKQK